MWILVLFVIDGPLTKTVISYNQKMKLDILSRIHKKLRNILPDITNWDLKTKNEFNIDQKISLQNYDMSRVLGNYFYTSLFNKTFKYISVLNISVSISLSSWDSEFLLLPAWRPFLIPFHHTQPSHFGMIQVMQFLWCTLHSSKKHRTTDLNRRCICGLDMPSCLISVTPWVHGSHTNS